MHCILGTTAEGWVVPRVHVASAGTDMLVISESCQNKIQITIPVAGSSAIVADGAVVRASFVLLFDRRPLPARVLHQLQHQHKNIQSLLVIDLPFPFVRTLRDTFPRRPWPCSAHGLLQRLLELVRGALLVCVVM